MEHTRYLVVGSGVSGLAFADGMGAAQCLILERESEPGGYCRTIVQDGFVWDYSGHFFHFRHPEIEKDLVSRMGQQKVLKVARDSRCHHDDGTLIDFPFQKNIHQLPREDFIDCLVDLYFREEREPESFKDMLYAKFGKSIAEKFLIPYNEKLYATDLSNLDVEAMGRFFPHADVTEIIANFRRADNAGYNATFTYPEGGAIQYIHALLRDVPEDRLRLGVEVLEIDLETKVAMTSEGPVRFEHLISSAPFNRLLAMSGVDHDPSIYTWNKVQVWNLGFDRKGHEGIHWIYFPQRDLSFYRVGFYDNIFGADRMSLYVEVGRAVDFEVTEEVVEDSRQAVLDDLRKVGIVTDHELVSSAHVVLDPAYVHITRRSIEEVARLRGELGRAGVHSIGRYGAWTYCSIEDNIVEARALAARLRDEV